MARPKPIKPEDASLYGQRAVLDPNTYTPELANRLAPFSGAAIGATTSLIGEAGQAGRSPIYDALEKSALDDLALGGGLSDEDTLAATQGARAAYGARGLNRSGAGIIGEVLRRAQFAQQRKTERRGFAAGVEGLRTSRLSGILSALGTTGALSTAGTALAENTRQFELERDDTMRFNDKRIAADIKIGNSNAAAAKSAGRSTGIGSILGGALSMIKI
jgi:hypothetical protein